MQNPYDVLGVARNSTPQQAREAYRRLARQLHPDRTGGDRAAEERLKEVNLAYADLCKGDRRQHGLEDILDQDFFSIFAGLGRHAGPTPHMVEVELEFQESMLGAHKAYSMDRKMACPSCQGRSRLGCTVCASTGRISKPDRVDFRIPAGMAEGDSVAARSHLGFPMIARLRVRPSAHWTREGLDLLMRIPFPVPHLVPGATIPVASPYASGTMELPAGALLDKPLRLPGMGVRHHSGRRGDLRVVLAPEVATDRGQFPASEAFRQWVERGAD